MNEAGEVFGYENLRVLDGSIIPGNLAVNPSLTILALSEYAMAQAPVFDEEKAKAIKPIQFSDALPGMASSLQGGGDLLAQAIKLSEKLSSAEQKVSEQKKVTELDPA